MATEKFNGFTFKHNNIEFNIKPINFYQIKDSYKIVIFELEYKSGEITKKSEIPYYLSDGLTNNYRGNLLLPFICFNEIDNNSVNCPYCNHGIFGTKKGTLYKYNISNNIDFTNEMKLIESRIMIDNTFKNISEDDKKHQFEILNFKNSKGTGIKSVLPRMNNLLDLFIGLLSFRIDDSRDITKTKSFRPNYNTKYKYNYDILMNDDDYLLYINQTLKNLVTEHNKNKNNITKYDENTFIPKFFSSDNISIDDVYCFFLNDLLQKIYKDINLINNLKINNINLNLEEITIEKFNLKYKICNNKSIFINAEENSNKYKEISYLFLLFIYNTIKNDNSQIILYSLINKDKRISLDKEYHNLDIIKNLEKSCDAMFMLHTEILNKYNDIINEEKFNKNYIELKKNIKYIDHPSNIENNNNILETYFKSVNGTCNPPIQPIQQIQPIQPIQPQLKKRKLQNSNFIQKYLKYKQKYLQLKLNLIKLK